jgi:NAD+ diphosphatase
MPDPIELPYCPHCGKRSFKSGRFKPWSCASCGFQMYPNIASAAAVFILNSEGRILFTERAKDPGKGRLGLPGGFLDAGESAESGVLREVREEVGLKLSRIQYLVSLPNEYFYGGLHYDTIDLFYKAETAINEVTLDPSEITRVYWKFAGEVEKQSLAFPSYYEALKLLKGFE